VEPFEFRVEALVRVAAYGEAWALGESIPESGRAAVENRLLGLFREGVKTQAGGAALEFDGSSVRFVVPDPEKGYVSDERAEIPVSEALVGLTLSASARGIEAFDLEWSWFAPGQERLVLEIASQGRPAARALTPAENRVAWRIDGKAELPELVSVSPVVRERQTPLMVPMRYLLLGALVTVGFVRHFCKGRPPRWTTWLVVAGLLLLAVGRLYRVERVVILSEQQTEEILHALLRNTYHAFDFREESAVYDTLAASVTGPLLERVYLEMRASLELEGEGGPRVRVHGIDLRQCQPSANPASSPESLLRRLEWITVGDVTHWGHTHERTNLYEAEVELSAVGDAWKIGELRLLNEERIQKVSRSLGDAAVEPPAP